MEEGQYSAHGNDHGMVLRLPGSGGDPVGMRRIFLDTEFTYLPWTQRSILFWVGLADEEGDTYSALCAEADTSEFIRHHVLLLIPETEPRLSRPVLKQQVEESCEGTTEFWAWFPTPSGLVNLGDPVEGLSHLYSQVADWDYQLLCDLVAPRPATWPLRCNDLHALAQESASSASEPFEPPPGPGCPLEPLCVPAVGRNIRRLGPPRTLWQPGYSRPGRRGQTGPLS